MASKKLLFASVLLGGCMAVPNPAAAQHEQGRHEEGAGKARKGSSITGCLSKGDTAGEYVLTNEKTGRKTTVTGPADLEKHSANHKVTLMGSRSTEGGKAVFKATSIKHISETCQAPAGK